jgi:DNA-binding PadR family transcriptional regulator
MPNHVFSIGYSQLRMLKKISLYEEIGCNDLHQYTLVPRPTDLYIICNYLTKKGWIKNVYRKDPHARGRINRYVSLTHLGEVALRVALEYQDAEKAFTDAPAERQLSRG